MVQRSMQGEIKGEIHAGKSNEVGTGHCFVVPTSICFRLNPVHLQVGQIKILSESIDSCS